MNRISGNTCILQTVKVLRRNQVASTTTSASKVMEGKQTPTTSLQNPSSFVKKSEDDVEVSSNNMDTSTSLGSPIGYIKSCFKSKNGTPRQPSVCSFSRAKLRVLKETFPNPEHSLQGLGQFSHIWIMFLFHKNGGKRFSKAKVKPPRLDGAKVGVFATRSPHRPNPIGLTLAKLDHIEGETLHISGVDIIDGTPVLDIKPYIPSYDNPEQVLCDQTLDSHTLKSCVDQETMKVNTASIDEVVRYDRQSVSKAKGDGHSFQVSIGAQQNDGNSAALDSSIQTIASDPEKSEPDAGREVQEIRADDKDISEGSKVKVPNWIKCPPIRSLDVRFTNHAEKELETFMIENSDPNYQLEFLHDKVEARQAIRKILEADPRSTYRRNHCQDRLYFFTVDTLHITCWFGADFVEVVRIQPVSLAAIP